eukprot:CAMPEP_0202487010 /NCGR_PEP_ID=MMETSP1361-20130828/5454_1 /ASSEMBLY_ACC=CAM_ASM_000849 /TAXON_ID=210615 /ORGANISM="Staurosira complex sp., Strain CCMP2646" /LENGTH=66 /DNA_ID=CAMNT_0049116305 /DNA_START=743 /DNA_END=943 /DNA_ORIENTATION=+
MTMSDLEEYELCQFDIFSTTGAYTRWMRNANHKIVMIYRHSWNNMAEDTWDGVDQVLFVCHDGMDG